MAKAVVDVAFNIMCLDEYHFAWFIFDDKICYDKILSIRCSASCQIFKRFSKAIKWLFLNHFEVSGYTHILHDFIFVDSAESYLCRYGLESFLELTFLRHKTVLPATSALVHGVKIDTIDPELRPTVTTRWRLMNTMNAYYVS